MTVSQSPELMVGLLSTVVLAQFCAPPEEGVFSTVTTEGLKIGHVAMYTCLKGYHSAESNNSRTCRNSSIGRPKWSGEALVCKANVQHSIPSNASNVTGSVCPTSWYQYEDAPYCYRFFSHRYDWHRAQNYCQTSFGANLAYIKSGTMTSWVTRLHRKTLKDPTGWFWIGVNDENEDGVWRTPGGKRVNYFRWQAGQPNEHTSANCVGVGAGRDYLDTNYTWYDRHCEEWWNFLCELRVGCPFLKAVTHASYKVNGYTVNRDATYKCDTGYHVTSGNANRMCTVSNTWSGKAPVCSRIVCGEPPLINNGTVVFSGIRFEDTATYRCDGDWVLKHGDQTRRCDHNGDWTGNTPFCLPPDGGGVIRQHTCEGETMKIRCKPGQQIDIIFAVYGYIHGNDNACLGKDTDIDHCQVFHSLALVRTQCAGNSGCDILAGESVFGNSCSQWSNSLDVRYKCIGCTFPKQVKYTNVTSSGQKYGDIARYTCHSGYNVSYGNDVRWCEDSGQWNGTLPYCSRISCGRLTTGEGVIFNSTTGHKYGDTIHYSTKCMRGYYHAEGDAHRQCLADGSWSGGDFVCKRVSCGPPEMGMNTRVHGTSYLYGDIVRFECFYGYQYINGSMTRECLENGTWTGEEQYCEEKPGPPLNEIKAQWKLVPKDEAPGSPFIGGVAIIFVVAVLSFVVVLDLVTCKSHMILLRKNCGYFREYFVEKWGSNQSSDSGNKLVETPDGEERTQTVVVLENGKPVNSDVVLVNGKEGGVCV